jgi:hypothetical protein
VDAAQNRLQQGIGQLGLDKLTQIERLRKVIRFHLNFIQSQSGIPQRQDAIKIHYNVIVAANARLGGAVFGVVESGYAAQDRVARKGECWN